MSATMNTLTLECYTYLWHRGCDRMGLMKYARYKSMLKYFKPEMNDKIIRSVFHKLVDEGHLIPIRKGKRTHFDYLFSQKPLYNLLDKEDYIKEKTRSTSVVVFE